VDIEFVKMVEGLGDPVRGMRVVVALDGGDLNSVIPPLRGRWRDREDGLKVILRVENRQHSRTPIEMSELYLSLRWRWFWRFSRWELRDFPHLPLVPNPAPSYDGIFISILFADGRISATAQSNVRTA
jgi:hypothetical protein